MPSILPVAMRDGSRARRYYGRAGSVSSARMRIRSPAAGGGQQVPCRGDLRHRARALYLLEGCPDLLEEVAQLRRPVGHRSGHRVAGRRRAAPRRSATYDRPASVR